jgi:DNA-binding NtrC family response regulator
MDNRIVSVLLVDDDEMIRECIGAYLEDEGFAVSYADSGEQALQSVAAMNPHVCVSDMRLTGMDGETFIIKAHAISPDTGFILHTGMSYILTDELRAVGMTAEDVLFKPVHELSILTGRIAAIVSPEGRG